ncbi:MAG: hypothetical protein ACREP3_13405 [Candidatus Binatia bacterium]
MSSENSVNGKHGKVMLVGFDNNRILEKRFLAAGYPVFAARDNEAAIFYARHEIFRTTVLVSRGSLINVAEAVFNLRDLNPSMEIIVLVDRLGKQTNRFLRQLLEHPIEGTQILTRRQLQKRLHAAGLPAPPGPSA